MAFSSSFIFPPFIVESFRKKKITRWKWTQQGNLVVLNHTAPFWQQQGQHFTGDCLPPQQK